jgi:Spy/CpxP family protein refolding chaperone
MMGGYGMGPGMMGGYGMGPGMMGGFGYGMGNWIPDLTNEQQAKINKIMDETRKSNWALMGSMMDLQAKLRDLYLAPKQDSNAISNVYKSIGQLQQKMYESAIDAQKRIDGVLTKEQHEKMRQFWRRGYGR